MSTTSKKRQYHSNKLKGGANNEKGNRFENHFAIFKVTEYLNSYSESKAQVVFSSQVEAFVDDLLIILEEDNKEFYQIKNSKSLKWEHGNKQKSLCYDFLNQKRIEKDQYSKFKLFLIVSSEPLQLSLTRSLPKSLLPYTEVVFFPYSDSIHNLVSQHLVFREELKKLIAVNSPPIDKLEALATAILGVWNACNKKDISLEDIYTHLEKMSLSFIRPREIFYLSYEIQLVLDLIPNFSYIVHNNYLTWKFKNTDTGIIPFPIGTPDFEEIETEILVQKPSSFEALETIIA